MKKFLLCLLFLGCAHAPNSANDPYKWLETPEDPKALAWVDAQNKISENQLASDANFKKMDAEALKILESKDRIPAGAFLHRNLIQNFWQDEVHVRGILRETTFAGYKQKNIPWTTILDVDALAKKEKENWIYKGMHCLEPAYRHCLVYLSRGGKDANVVREFDRITRSFVKDGFSMPESKGGAAWVDQDNLLVFTDYGAGTMTDSSYPRTVHLWKRGTKLQDAKLVFEASKTDMRAAAGRWVRGNQHLMIISRSVDIFNSEDYIYDEKTGEKKQIKKPAESDLEGYFDDQILLQLRKPWKLGDKTYETGSVLSFPVATAGRDIKPDEVQLVFVPKANQAFRGVHDLKSKVLVSVLEDVKSKILVMERQNGKWTEPQPLALEGSGDINVEATTDEADLFMHTAENFDQPSTLYSYEFGKKTERLKSLPAYFDAKNLVIEQKFATSKDGTKVPYFLVYKKGIKFDGTAPTMQYAYGGFMISQTAGYNALVGKLWLERGGVYVLANIRGGGEYGPKWHEAALKENRQKAYDDFAAVSEDLIASKVTSPAHLGIRGGSNGGLLVGVMMTERPELYGAVVCLVPLLDMIRYPQIGAGSSWMAEYGDPTVPMYHRAIMKYSPYQNVFADKKYPPVFFATSTKDDRVQPAHARKMAAKMEDQKHQVLFWENTEGGHAASANHKQIAKLNALQYNFLWKTIK